MGSKEVPGSRPVALLQVSGPGDRPEPPVFTSCGGIRSLSAAGCRCPVVVWELGPPPPSSAA